METATPLQELPLEHFELIEDVIAHIRTKLPADSGPGSWRAVCEDVLHCQLPAVEPLLLNELAAAQGNPDEQSKIRALLRAVSWYRHPPKSVQQLLTEVQALRPAHPSNEDQTQLDTIQAAFEQQLEGEQVLRAASAIDALFAQAQNEEQKTQLRQLRDQVYYQLLYPHWFEVVKRWAASQPTA